MTQETDKIISAAVYRCYLKMKLDEFKKIVSQLLTPEAIFLYLHDTAGEDIVIGEDGLFYRANYDLNKERSDDNEGM